MLWSRFMTEAIYAEIIFSKRTWIISVCWCDTWWCHCTRTFQQSITATSYWSWWRLKSPTTRLFIQLLLMRRSNKTPRHCHWPLWGFFIGGRGLPRTNDQWRGKCFHLKTSSWIFCISRIMCSLIRYVMIPILMTPRCCGQSLNWPNGDWINYNYQ